MIAHRPIHSAMKVKAHRAADHSALQGKLTVGEIMIPRSDFICALAHETVAKAFSGVDPIFDALPVVEGSDKADLHAEIVGVIDRRAVKRPTTSTVVSEMADWDGKALSFNLPLIDFVRAARGDVMQFVEGAAGGVAGLVTIFDIQRLPVRIALFAALTDLEEDISALIDLFSSPTEWRDLVSPTSRDLVAEIEKGLKRAERRDDLGAPILALGFGCKVAILNDLVRTGKIFGLRDMVQPKVVTLRNDVAHGTPFADVTSVPSVLSEAVSIHSKIKKVLI